MNRIFKYISASALLLASFVTVANAQLTEKEQALINKSVKLDKWTTPGPTEGTYYLNLETFITGYTSNVTKYETTTVSTPLDIVLVLDVSGSMGYRMDGTGDVTNHSNRLTTSNVPEADQRITQLKSAVNTFVSTIKTDAVNNNVEHRIGIVKFAGNKYPDDSEHSVTTYSTTNSTTSNTGNLNTRNTYYVLVNGSYLQVKYCDNQGRTGWNRDKSWRYNSSGNTWTTLGDLGSLPVYSSVTNTVLDTIIEGNDTYTNSNVYNRSQVVKNFASVSTDSDDITGAVNSLKFGGGTYANYGMNLAKLVFDKGARSDALKVLIFFTDGVPGQSGWDATVANGTIAASKPLKESGVKVYTIGVFSDLSDDNATRVPNYMKYTSSNYPNAKSMDSPGTATSDADFYKKVSNASELSDVFEKISQETSQEAANANAGYTEATTENNVTIKDIVTSNFVIPSDADGNIDLSKIEIYTAKSTGVTRADNFDYQNYAYTEDGYSWAEEELSTLEPVAVRDSESGKTTVSVPGFDFSANWVGFQNDEYESHDGGKTYTRPDDAVDELHDGYKLIIKVLVEPDPNAIGGSVPTNDKNSGLYITDKDGKEVSLKSYPVPGSVLVPMDLTIIMNGITDRGDYNLYKPGETAIFQVTSYDGKKWTVPVTANESGVGQASIKVPFHNDAEKDTYTVTELPDWSYRFNSIADPEIAGNPDGAVISKQITDDDHTFYFVATDTEKRDNGDQVSYDFQKFFYDESNNNNVFNSSANPTGPSTTSRKK